MSEPTPAVIARAIEHIHDIERYTSDDQDRHRAQQAVIYLNVAAARIAELEAQVEKCDKTRDGVVIHPRMVLYAKTYGHNIRDVQALMLVESSIGCYVAAASCWSTRSAAEAAAKEGVRT